MLTNILEQLWMDYCELNPQAKRIFDLLSARGENVINDHIAFRTVLYPRFGIESLAQHFAKYGYVKKGEYEFVEKKLWAHHFEHSDASMPKIFISELLLQKMSVSTQKILGSLLDQVPDDLIRSEKFVYCGRPWNLNYSDYLELAKESEYASWVAALGFRSNHFTVSVNHLKTFKDLQSLNSFILGNGYELNKSGGLIKGTPAELLEQSSTMAKPINVQFKEGTFEIPGCYYEFARRYPMANGQLYQGFIAKSADKIFESTNKIS